MTNFIKNNNCIPKEEQSPLLLFFNENAQKGRYEKISSGATTVITQWPGHISSCWMCCLAACFIMILFGLLMFASTIPSVYILQEKCKTGYHANYNQDHLVYVVHGPNTWTHEELQLLEKIVKIYVNFDIKILITLPINEQSIRNLEDLRLYHPKLEMKNVTFEQVFQTGPLHNTWQNLNLQTKLFAMRVTLLWNAGGIAFDLSKKPEFSNGNKCKDIGSNFIKNRAKIILNHHNNELLENEFVSFLQLGEDSLKIDIDGIHMETKIPCHSFFGEILMVLRKSGKYVTPNEIIQKTLKKFDRKGQVIQAC